ncbi:MAG: class I SAM-dependent methyltransferase, partial [Spartobacteria bacterium]|nr:class I SAM-dependent methyltransferase [Spartobacteria bacterium]
KLSRFRQTGHILDVGAGHGFFLAACRAAGWQCRGIEPSVQCRAFAEEKYNLHLSGGSIREFDAQGVLFDVVTFWNVLDQLPSPTEALAATCRLLRPGGVVIIRSPNARFHVPVKKLLRGMGRISPIFYRLDQTVFHLYSFDQHTIRAMLRHAGFNEIKVAPAELSWTTAHHAKSAFIKKPVTLFVELLAKSIFLLSTKQCLLAPSLLVVGHRSPNPHAQNMRGSQRMDWR